MASNARTYQVPETRLPFVNSEIAEVKFKGEPHLVSAIWGGKHVGGQVYFWDPLSGSHFRRQLPAGVPGAYIIKPAADGRLYLGCGNGDLVRYDPESDSFKTLVTGELSSITWGGCVTDRLVVWTASPGDACVYDWRAEKLLKKFAPLDSELPKANYGHNALEAPDGKILVFMNTPQARIVMIDPKDLSARSITPKCVLGHSSIANPYFVDERTLMFISGGTCQLLNYPQFELRTRVPLPSGGNHEFRKSCAMGGDCYALFESQPGLWRFRGKELKWEQVIDDWSAEDGGYLGGFQNKYIARVTVAGIAMTFDPATGHTTKIDLENWGLLDPHGFCVGPESDIIVGAPFINASFWTIDTKTGEGKHRGRAMPGGGQINQIVWDSRRRRALLSAYTAAAVTEFDPAEPIGWPENPRLVASAHDQGQMRPLAMLFDGRYAWMTTGASYGKLGGALSRIDPETNEIKIFRDLIPDQAINSLVHDATRRMIYGATHVHADCESAPATQSTAEVVAFDTAALTLARHQPLREGAPSLRAVCMLPDATVLIAEGGSVWSWNPQTGAARPLEELPAPLSGVATASDGSIWASMTGSIGLLKLDGDRLRFSPRREHLGGILQITVDTLWYAIHTMIYAVPLAELQSEG